MNELQTTGANVPDIVRQLIKSCNAMKEPSLTAFLPLLRFEGHPYNLKFHFQLEPLYRLQYPRRTVIMTGRQVGKSQGLVSSCILRCGLIPNKHMMICEPQFMQVRQISNIVFRNMVSQAYISNYLIGPNCNNSMLIREFCSGSRAHFAYIGGDASRIRGVSGISLLVVDECTRWDTDIITIDTQGKIKIVPIKDIKAGNFVLSFDFSDKPRILISVVKRNASYKGKRACFKVTTEAGRQIVCTADHPLPTSLGAKRLSEVIDYEYTRRTSNKRWDHSDPIKCHNGIITGGREFEVQFSNNSGSKMESWGSTRSLCECQIHPLTRVSYQTTVSETESRIRQYLEHLNTKEPWNVWLVTSDDVSKWVKDKKSDRGISFPHNTSYSPSLALDGRWEQRKGSECWNSSHQWIFEGRCGTSTILVPEAVGSRDNRYRSETFFDRETLMDTDIPNEGIYKALYSNSALYDRVIDIQSDYKDNSMSCLWEDYSEESLRLLLGRMQPEIQKGSKSQLLSGEHRSSQGTSEKVQRGTQRGNSCSEKRVEQEHDSRAKNPKKQEGSRTYEGNHGRSRSSRASQSYEKSQKSQIEGGSRIRSKIEGREEEILRENKGRSREICRIFQEEERTEGTSCLEKELIVGAESSYSYDRIVSIEYVGEDDVYDIEVIGTHNFITASGLASYNCDDCEVDVINIAAETMSAVKEGGTYLFTGTPKLTDGTLPYYYNMSSGGEITIRCEHCNKVNIASVEYDLLKMIGKTTCVCAKCGKPLDVRKSYYTFRRPELRASFDGFHLSQVTHPLHCTSVPKWRELLNKLENYPKSQAYNELLGEPCDEAVRLITRGDLETASTGLDNDISVALTNARQYGQLILGIDWGGYGIEGESFTVMAIVGLKPMERRLEVLYIEKIPTGKKHEEQVAKAVSLAEEFRCAAIAHDGTGAGAIKEEMLNQEMKGEGILTVPLVYMWAPRQDALRYMEPNNGHAGYYALDKTRSLALTIGAIKAKQLLLPNYKSCSNLLDDFLALGEDIRSTQNSGEIRIITRMGTHPDDTAHAINLAANALWHMNKCRPDLGSMVNKYDNQPDWASEGSGLQL